MSADPNPEKAIFLEAVERHAPQEWPGFLDRACAGQPELRGRVESLLAAHQEIGTAGPGNGAEGASPAATVAGPPVREGPGTVIGPYRLLEQIGEGGFGVVFLAEQSQPVRRRVALKVLRPGMDTRQVVARFEAERQALALMDHPNIARVFDGGATPLGRPYFVMELVKGVSITEFSDQNQLTPRQRLELLIPVCQAVQHAHQKGIIHRDLKPSNVLVTMHDTTPVVKVIDFGVAKALGQELTDKTLFTGFAQMVGTPLYMAPEQAGQCGLDVDTRSDIYSLGVLLYELLTGTTPFTRDRFKTAAYDEIRRIIREEEPPRPSTRLSESKDSLSSISALRQTEPARLTRLVRGELDWIVMKALEKDRNRRYETANALAMDLLRHLADEPISAGPPSAWYRLRKFARRNAGPVLAVGIILVVLVGGIIGTTWGMVRAEEHRLVAEAREKEVRAERDAKARALQAEKRARDQALAALRAMTDEIVENQMARGTTLSDENREFLRTILKHFEGFAALSGDDAESRAIRAEGHGRVGLMRARLGELTEAETALAEALALRKQLAADFPTRPEFREDLAQSYSNLGTLFRQTGRLREAEAAYGDALALQKQLAGNQPARPELRQALAATHTNLGGLFDDTGRPGEAEAAYAAAIALRKQLAADFPERFEFRRGLANSQYNLGRLLRDTGRLPDAAKAYTEALALRKQLVAEFPARPDLREELAQSHQRLGKLFKETGRPAEAESAYRDALAIQKQLAAEFPSRPEFRADLVRSHTSLGILLKDTGRLPGAEAAYADALAIQQQLAADFPSRPEFREELAAIQNNLGVVFLRTQRLKQAESAYGSALALRKQLAAEFPDRPGFRHELARGQINLGNLLAADGRPAEAESAYRAALAILRQLVADLPTRPEFRQDLASAQNNLGALLREMGRLQEAESAYREALDLRKQLAAAFPTRPQFRQNLAGSHNNLGTLLQETGRQAEAESAYRDALGIFRQLAADSPNQPDLREGVALTLGNLAGLSNERQEFQAAKAHLEEALPHHQAALRANPRNSTYRRFHRESLWALAEANAGLRDQAGAVRAAETLRDLGWDPPRDACDAAAALARCLAIVAKAKNLDQATRQAAAQFYGDEAMKRLRAAVAQGFKDAERLKRDTGLASLREREDFKKLLREVEADTKESPR